MLRRTAIQKLTSLALALPASAFLTGCDAGKTASGSGLALRGVDISGASYAKDLSLPDQNGQIRTLASFAGKVVIVFFGYTQCPDVCPSSLSEMAATKKLLGADGPRLQPLFISVDPERDTPEIMKAYMASFGPDFLALLPSPAQLPALTKDFRIYYKKVPGRTPGSYTMDHSAGSYMYDPQGRLRVFNKYQSGAEALAHDVRLLLNQ